MTTMSLPETHYGVWLHDRRVGSLIQRGDFTQFVILDEYREDPLRPVLGLRFEQNLTSRYSSSLRLPPWFSNLLPEGVMRDWIADERGVSAAREMELLAQVGHDLPGAVRVAAAGEDVPLTADWKEVFPNEKLAVAGSGETPEWRFSLAGVALKFSMLRLNDRLTLPASGIGGDWIVKLPDSRYPFVPLNEFMMMVLAGRCGLDVPDVMLVNRDQLPDLPPKVWPNAETWAYAVRRFDRDEARQPIHMEDLAQIRDLYPYAKYQGNFETIASLIFRQRDMKSLREFAGRLGFNVLISNGDAHLKNWSLLYGDPRIPILSPAYDLVSTAPYRDVGFGEENLGIKFAKTKRFSAISLGSFDRLERLVKASDAGLSDRVAEVGTSIGAAWPDVLIMTESIVGHGIPLFRSMAESLEERRSTLLRR